MRRTASLLILAWGSSVLAAEVPIDSTISYQGRLTDGGDPAEGDYDMRFSLLDAVAGGNQVGPTLIFDGGNNNLDPVEVMGGLFQVGLTFGDGVFLGDALWLEIRVRPHANGQYVPLDPRQPLTAVPFALYALDGPGGADGVWSTNGSHIFNLNRGNVGIGTSTPTNRLDVVGVIRSFGANGGNLLAENPNNPTAGVGLSWLNDVARLRISGEGPGAGNGFDIQRPGNRSLMRITGAGDVGIGTTNPIARLEVAGGILSSGPDGGDLSAQNPNNPTAGVGLGWHNDVARIRIGGDGPGAGGGFDIQKTGNRSLMRILHNGNVGIGTTTPRAKLHVWGDGTAAVMELTNGGDGTLALQISSVGGSSRAASFFGVTSNDLLRVENNGSGRAALIIGDAAFLGGNVGIGTTEATAKLSVLEADDDTAFAINVINSGTRGGAGIFSSTNSSSTQPTLFALSFSSAPAFQTFGDAIIGGTARVEILEIVGADLAEKFPVSDKPEPGMVVEIDPDRTGTLRIARGGVYNPRVAGVVSGANDLSVGAVLGHLPGHEDAPPIALSGRVWVQCDASTGAINPGDLLTTSNTPGHAMKATDRTRAYGATIGKAMSSLKEGRGMVLVLVSLQ